MTHIIAELTKEDYSAYKHYVIFKYRKYHYLFVLMWMGMMAMISFYDYDSLSHRISTMLSTTILWIVLGGGFSLLHKVIAKFSRSAPKCVVGKHEFELTPEGFKENNENGMSLVKYDKIKRIASEPNYIFLLLNSGSGYIIPKRAFHEQQHELDFLKKLQEFGQAEIIETPKNSKLGFVSIAIGVIATIIWCGALAGSAVLGIKGGGADHQAFLSAMGILMLVALSLNIVGFIFGVFMLIGKTVKRKLSIGGILLNSEGFVAIIFIILLDRLVNS